MQITEALRSDILHEDLLEVAESLISLNDGHYTAWYATAQPSRLFRYVRRSVIERLSLDLHKELDWVRRFATSKAKNYQLWHHRQWIVDKLDDPSDELSRLAFLVDDNSAESDADTAGDSDSEEEQRKRDQKNYHAWQYRQWLVRRFSLPAAPELALTERLIEEDAFNNSAWNHRAFIVHRMEPPGLDKASELLFADQRLARYPSNRSAHNYRQWIADSL